MSANEGTATTSAGPGAGRGLTIWARHTELTILHILSVLFTAVFSVHRTVSDT